MTPTHCRCGNVLHPIDYLVWDCCSSCAHPGVRSNARPGVLECVERTSRDVIAWQASVDEVSA